MLASQACYRSATKMVEFQWEVTSSMYASEGIALDKCIHSRSGDDPVLTKSVNSEIVSTLWLENSKCNAYCQKKGERMIQAKGIKLIQLCGLDTACSACLVQVPHAAHASDWPCMQRICSVQPYALHEACTRLTQHIIR